MSSRAVRACMATSAVLTVVMVGGIGLSSASATVAPQTITFTSTVPAASTYGSTYTVAATASSGLPVTFTVDPPAGKVCSLSGAQVKFIGVGTCTIDANQAGNATYAPAQQVQQSSTDGPASQTIRFTSTAPVGQVSGGPSYIVAASSPSGLPITFTIAPASNSVCVVSGSTPGAVAGSTGTVSGATVNFVSAGTCTINADQPGNSFYTAATQAQQSVAVTTGLQAISFNSVAPKEPQVGGSYRVAAYTGSGTTVALAVASASRGVCSLSGVGVVGPLSVGTVKFTNVGTCAIIGSQPGNSQFRAAPVVTQSFRIAKAKASSLTVAARTQKGKLVVSGKLKLPSGITAARGYSGKIMVTAAKGKTTLVKVTGKVSGKNGQYSVTLAHASAATSLTVTFGGNATLVASTTKHALSQR